MDYNRYFTNTQLYETLQPWQAAYPNLLQLSELGRSFEKRPIWLLSITNQASGPASDKPAVWIDANIHATEIAGTTTVLRLVETLLSGYGQDPAITHLLDNAVYYIVPRLNPDGAELAMADQPRYIRSGVRPYPWAEKDSGLHEQDVDKDGRILQMRIKDPNGDWKISSLDPRLLEKRDPGEYGGQYYRLLPEGLLEDFDGWQIKMARPQAGLDFNRNFPFEWRTEGDQQGAGPYPASEPEIKAALDFISAHPNISIAITYHTFSRVILRPYSTKSDDDMETADLWVYKLIGELGTKITGYRNVSTFHDFKYHPKEVTTGAFDDWIYDHHGAYAFTIEQWDLPTAAGIENRKFIEWYRLHPHSEDLQILQWVDQNAGPGGYVDWYPFQHPQLGEVELGGWDVMYTWRNPPHQWMGAESERNVPFALAVGDLLPRLEIHDLSLTPLKDGEFHLNLVVDNAGFLPTFTSQQGKNRQAVRPVRVELELPEDITLLTGQRRQELGHLEGRSNKLESAMVSSESATDNRARAEWVLKGPAGAQIGIHVLSERGGSLHRQISLP